VRVGALKTPQKQSEPLEKSDLTQRREILRDYEWSSYPAYAGLVEAPKWLSLQEVRERTGLSQRKYRQELDRRITEDQLGLDWEGEIAAGILMGKKEMVGLWKKLLLQRAGGARRSETPRFGLVSWEEITSAIEKEWRKPWPELRKSRGNSARAIAIWFARHRAEKDGDVS
jgi:hypothetical protein